MRRHSRLGRVGRRELAAGLVVIVGMGAGLVACGSSGGPAGLTGTAGAAGGPPEADAAAGSDSAAGVDGAAGAPGGLDCATYCATIQAACTTSLSQYSDMPSCLMSCGAFAPGTSADSTGDTLGCRASHARQAAASAAAAATECTRAGPGGDGVCGTNCDGYCDIVMTYCTDANSAKIYDTRAECMTDCAARMTNEKLDSGDPGRTDTGDQVACILYHAQMGSVAPDEHCLGDLSLTAGTCR